MTERADAVMRTATARDVAAIRAFGAEHIPAHYEPLIGREAAAAQVRDWWGEERIAPAVAEDRVVVAEAGGEIVGVGERGLWEGDHVVWKLYVHPDRRGRGLGRRLLDALVDQLPVTSERVLVEHFAANRRAARFYEREGFAHLRTEPGPEGREEAMAVVWRARGLTG